MLNYTITFHLHDAVYLYLRTVNQTLAEGYTNLRDGRLIRNKTIEQRFTGKFLSLHSLLYISADWTTYRTKLQHKLHVGLKHTHSQSQTHNSLKEKIANGKWIYICFLNDNEIASNEVWTSDTAAAVWWVTMNIRSIRVGHSPGH